MSTTTSKYVVAHGSLKLGNNNYARVGETVELEDEFVKQVDPNGENFVSEEKWLAMEEKKELEQRISEMSDDEKSDALKVVVATRKPKKPKTESEA